MEEMYCGKTTENEYMDFFESILQVKMCGHKNKDIVKVTIVEANDCAGTHYGYKEHATGKFMYIYEGKELVSMCSPDGFKRTIASGKGSIVKLHIQEIHKE